MLPGMIDLQASADPESGPFGSQPFGPFGELRATLAATPSPALQMLGVASGGVRVLGFRGMGNHELDVRLGVLKRDDIVGHQQLVQDAGGLPKRPQ